MMTSDICLMTGSEQARLIRERKISSKEVVQAMLNKIEEINPKVNAYCTLSKSAIDDAERADHMLSKGTLLGPLHGVPVSIKDLIESKGLKTTFGSSIYSDYVSKEDDVVVERLRQAGAIIIGKTNTPEFGYNGVTYNSVFGTTRNPWNLERTPGGSSGGAAASVVANMGSLAIGSDGGGSIRIPSSFCGIYGIKPTFGRVPLFPGCRVPEKPGASSWESLECIGPMTKTVEDSALVLSIIVGEDIRDRHSLPSQSINYLDALKGDIEGLKIAWTPDWGYASVDHEVRAITKRAVSVFNDELGCKVEEVNFNLDNIGNTFWTIVANNTDLKGLRTIRKKNSGALSDSLEDILEMNWSAEDITSARMERQYLYNKMRMFMERYDLILTPTTPCVAFELGSDFPKKIENNTDIKPFDLIALTSPLNLTGQPAATVPVGYTEDGLPVGLQIIGRRLDEMTVLRASAAFERVRPWYQRTPLN